MRTLTLLLLPAVALAQTELPSAVPYTGTPVTTTVVTPSTPTALVPVNTYTVSYTTTLSGTFPNPRQTALGMAIKQGLTMVLENRMPAIPATQVKALTEDSDPAGYLTTYQILKEILTPQYTLTTSLTFNPRRINSALEKLETPATPVAEDISDTTSLTKGGATTLTLRLANPSAASLHSLISKAEATIPGTAAEVTSLARDAALIAVTTPDTDMFLTRLQGQGLTVEPVGMTYWVQ